ncbi:MAG: hypothetical protein ACTIJ9_10060 [Aequorivita sp.]
MKKKVRITSNAEMLDFIKDSDLQPDELKSLFSKAYGIYISGTETKAEIINLLTTYFEKYGQQDEKPLFLE